MNKELRVAHYPQLPCKPFIVDVDNLEEAKKIFDVLANYDLFQYENNIKPDYSNITALEEYREEEDEWYDWVDDETGINDIHEYFDHLQDNEV